MGMISNGIFSLAARVDPQSFDPAHMPHAIALPGYGEIPITHTRKDLFGGPDQVITPTGPQRLVHARVVQANHPAPANVSALAREYTGSVDLGRVLTCMLGVTVGMYAMLLGGTWGLVLGGALMLASTLYLIAGVRKDPTAELQAAVEQARWHAAPGGA